MCASNIKNGKLDFTGNTIACFCKDGNSYDHSEKCVACKGRGKTPKNGRNYRCKPCNGSGSTYLETPVLVGKCHRCNGTSRVPADRFDSVNAVDREILFTLFNFDKPYAAKTSSFNEQYLGMNVVTGVTDYGRYISMTPAEFKDEVKKNFSTGFMQYVSLLDRAGNLPTEILITKKSSGWFAYPVY